MNDEGVRMVTHGPLHGRAAAELPVSDAELAAAGRRLGLADPWSAGLSRREILRLGGAGLLGAAAFGGLSGCAAVPKPAPADAPRKKGGVYSHGATGGGLKDTLDPHFPVTNPDIARCLNLYEPLLRWNNKYELEPCVAESVRVDSGLGGELLITPGVLFDVEGEAPDVMRGEETQIAGALLQHPEFALASCLVMPGTHSKWVSIEQGKIIRFASYLTGELFSVLKKHSILGRLMPEACGDEETGVAAFEMGLAAARASAPGDFAHQIFAARTLGLTGRLAPTALADYLSGVLIGHELCSGLAGSVANLPAAPVLIGDSVLCRRYAHALSYFGRPAALQLDNTAPAGLWQVAHSAGLLG